MVLQIAENQWPVSLQELFHNEFTSWEIKGLLWSQPYTQSSEMHMGTVNFQEGLLSTRGQVSDVHTPWVGGKGWTWMTRMSVTAQGTRANSFLEGVCEDEGPAGCIVEEQVWVCPAPNVPLGQSGGNIPHMWFLSTTQIGLHITQRVLLLPSWVALIFCAAKSALGSTEQWRSPPAPPVGDWLL